MTCRDELTALPNIGTKLAGMLRGIGIASREQIRKAGPSKIYRRLQAKSERRLPVCYYLYALEGAVRGIRWAELSERDKADLRTKAGLRK